MNEHIYMVVEKDETGKTTETRVRQSDLAEHIDDTFMLTSIQILAIIRLSH